MTASVVVLGSANMDLVVRQPRRVERGETIFGTSFRTGPGGKGLNQAVAAARAGAAVTFIGAVGADDFGARLREWLAGEGIDVSLLRTTESPSGIAQITVTDDGENAIVVVPGANSVDDLTVADREAIASAAFLVVQLERPESLVREALTHAHAHGVTTVLTPAPARTGIEDFVALADILVANEGEAALLSGEPDAEAAAVALSRTARTVVVTRGSRGALVAARSRPASRHAPSPRSTRRAPATPSPAHSSHGSRRARSSPMLWMPRPPPPRSPSRAKEPRSRCRHSQRS